MWLKFNVSIKKPSEKFGGIGIKYYLCTRNPPHNGSLAEWLGAGLQNRLQQFESARNLSKPDFKSGFSFIVHIMSLGFQGGMVIKGQRIFPVGGRGCRSIVLSWRMVKKIKGSSREKIEDKHPMISVYLLLDYEGRFLILEERHIHTRYSAGIHLLKNCAMRSIGILSRLS